MTLDAVALRAFVADQAMEGHVPGIAVGVLHGDDEVVVTHGVTNVENPLDVDRRTLFQIGSTTKTFTATAVMRLVEDGIVGLDDPVVDHLSDFRLAQPGAAEQVTVRHLLTHTGGWAGDWFLLTAPDYGREGALAKVVADMANSPQLFAPGATFSYNNAGFYALGRLVEVKTGRPFPEAVRSLVLDPAGLTHSFFHADEMITHRVAAGHVPVGDVAAGGVKVHRPWPRPFFAWPAGALNSCVDDLFQWARVWFGDRDVLSVDGRDAMLTPQVPIDGEDAVGLCWMLKPAGGFQLIEHGGATNGYLTEFLLCPAERLALVILSNSTTAAAANKRIQTRVLDHALGVVEHLPEPIESTSDALAPYAGRYGFGQDAPWAHEIVVDGDRLTFIAGTPGADRETARFRLALCGTDQVVCTEPAGAAGNRGTFGRDATGTVSWVRFGLRVYNRQRG